jgi:hypothetical protein
MKWGEESKSEVSKISLIQRDFFLLEKSSLILIKDKG